VGLKQFKELIFNAYKKLDENLKLIVNIDEVCGPTTICRDAATGTNDPCPCGSGKKYKNCCGAISCR